MKKQDRSNTRSKYHQKPKATNNESESESDNDESLDGESASKNKSYRKRTVESNWNRYEEDLDPNSETNRFTIKQEISTTFNLNFNDLLANSYESSKCVLAPKDENLNNLSDDFLKLDKNKLTRAINCLRFQDLIKFNDNDIDVRDCFEENTLKVLDEQWQKSNEEFDRWYKMNENKSLKTLEIKEDFEFLKDLNLNKPDPTPPAATKMEEKSETNVNDWLDDLLN